MKDMVSIKARYPGLQGLVLYNKVVEHWQFKGVARLRFLGPDGKPLLSRHPLNQNRGQGQILEQYTGRGPPVRIATPLPWPSNCRAKEHADQS